MIAAGWSKSASLLRPSITLIRGNTFQQSKNASFLSFFDRFKIANSKSTSKVKLGVAGVRIYEQIADKIDYPTFFIKFKLPNTYNSWFLVTELHVWMALSRCMAMDEAGRTLRSSIVETMWQDASTRAKQLGADNPSAMRKQLQVLSQQFQAALITYDDGLMHDDKSLATSLWVRLFDRKCENYEDLTTLVEYVRRQIQILDDMKEEELLNKPVIGWEKISEFKPTSGKP
uniref:CSON008085 protein n=1 Tax=Culicoides sonorensis TaxID=179676 RepID=A0A336N0M6_CULSO